ncbi:MAG: hypothetical protein U1G07_05990 [Verrucomicrobiota bacterium]
MASQFDESDFIDREFQSSQGPYAATPGHSAGSVVFRPPTREELDTRVGEAQRKLAELRRAQEELERERAGLEEARRRRHEFQAGREEMLHHLTRGVALAEKAEGEARRNADQLSKTLARLHEALQGVQAIREESWTEENWNVELTKSLAAIENARMEWNRAQLAWPILNGQDQDAAPISPSSPTGAFWEGKSFWQLCQLGVAITWPVALVGLIGMILLALLRVR